MGCSQVFLEAPELLAEALAGGARREGSEAHLRPAPRPRRTRHCALARAGAGRASPGSGVRASRPGADGGALRRPLRGPAALTQACWQVAREPAGTFAGDTRARAGSGAAKSRAAGSPG